MPSVIFCQCGSDKVDVNRWKGGVPVFRCAQCGHEEAVRGFTLGRFGYGGNLRMLEEARKDRAMCRVCPI